MAGPVDQAQQELLMAFLQGTKSSLGGSEGKEKVPDQHSGHLASPQ